jgi:hypothetical protein
MDVQPARALRADTPRIVDAAADAAGDKTTKTKLFL